MAVGAHEHALRSFLTVRRQRLTAGHCDAEQLLAWIDVVEVEVRRLTPGAYEFLFALAEGRSVGEAIDWSIANVTEFDLTECFETLIYADVTVGLEPVDSRKLSTA